MCVLSRVFRIQLPILVDDSMTAQEFYNVLTVLNGCGGADLAIWRLIELIEEMKSRGEDLNQITPKRAVFPELFRC